MMKLYLKGFIALALIVGSISVTSEIQTSLSNELQSRSQLAVDVDPGPTFVSGKHLAINIGPGPHLAPAVDQFAINVGTDPHSLLKLV